MRDILFENGTSVAQVIKTTENVVQFSIVSNDGNGMIYVSYKEFESFVKSLAHLFIMMGKENEYKEFWNTVNSYIEECCSLK